MIELLGGIMILVGIAIFALTRSIKKWKKKNDVRCAIFVSNAKLLIIAGILLEIEIIAIMISTILIKKSF